MVTDRQVRILMKQLNAGQTLAVSAAKAGMDEKTARRYRHLGQMPSQCQAEHTWRTREDPFASVWEQVRTLLADQPGLQAKTLLEELMRRHPGRFQEGQLRTLQRKVKAWRAAEGPSKEVFFPQQHPPGRLCQSDFCHLTDLNITLAGRPFAHLLYHFVLTCSNWETGTLCATESLESLSAGLQNALWELGGVPERHRTDSLTAAVQKLSHPEDFTPAYRALLSHYGLIGEYAQPRRPNENGDVEQSHRRFKERLGQALMLRGSRDFADRDEYAAFLRRHFAQANAGRTGRLAQERPLLRPLPPGRLEACQRLWVRVGPGSTIRVQNNVYSVHSRLIGERVEVRLFGEHLEVWYAQKRSETLPRLRGKGRHHIHWRHLIDWLVRKPGAFAQYRYRDAFFPTSRFRMAYDQLAARQPQKADGQYLKILALAAMETLEGVDEALRLLLVQEQAVSLETVTQAMRQGQRAAPVTEVRVEAVDLSSYDALLSEVRAPAPRGADGRAS
jgi:hypothetical protein